MLLTHLLGLDLPVLDVHLVAAQHDRDVFTHPEQARGLGRGGKRLNQARCRVQPAAGACLEPCLPLLALCPSCRHCVLMTVAVQSHLLSKLPPVLPQLAACHSALPAAAAAPRPCSASAYSLQSRGAFGCTFSCHPTQQPSTHACNPRTHDAIVPNAPAEVPVPGGHVLVR